MARLRRSAPRACAPARLRLQTAPRARFRAASAPATRARRCLALRPNTNKQNRVFCIIAPKSRLQGRGQNVHSLQKRSILYDCVLSCAPLLRPCRKGEAEFAARGGFFSRALLVLVLRSCPSFSFAVRVPCTWRTCATTPGKPITLLP